MIWVSLGRPVDLGSLPSLLSEDDPRGAREQLDDRYRYGGGWRPLKGVRLSTSKLLLYPGDPPQPPIAAARLRDETIILYPYSFLAVIQPDGSFEVSRVD